MERETTKIGVITKIQSTSPTQAFGEVKGDGGFRDAAHEESDHGERESVEHVEAYCHFDEDLLMPFLYDANTAVASLKMI